MTTLREKYEWKKVEAPKTWRPKYNGEELVGFYGGRTIRSGSFGQYEVVIVHVPGRGSFMLSGTQLIQLIDAASADVGDPIRVVWGGYLKLGEAEDGREKKMKQFTVFVVDGERLAPEDMPAIKESRQ